MQNSKRKHKSSLLTSLYFYDKIIIFKINVISVALYFFIYYYLFIQTFYCILFYYYSVFVIDINKYLYDNNVITNNGFVILK